MVLLNVANYGYFNFLKMCFWEAIYSLKNNYRTQLFYDELITSKYKEIKNLSGVRKKNIKSFNAPYAPTPIFFLKIIKDQIKILNLKNYIFIDFGCGAGRTLMFFNKNFKKKIGIDFNINYLKFIKTGKFYNFNLRNLDKIKKIIKENFSKKYVLYFYEPFDEKLIVKICKKFIHKKIFIILINTKKIKLNKTKIIYQKLFYNHQKNIRIYKNAN